MEVQELFQSPKALRWSPQDFSPFGGKEPQQEHNGPSSSIPQQPSDGIKESNEKSTREASTDHLEPNQIPNKQESIESQSMASGGVERSGGVVSSGGEGFGCPAAKNINQTPVPKQCTKSNEISGDACGWPCYKRFDKPLVQAEQNMMTPVRHRPLPHYESPSQTPQGLRPRSSPFRMDVAACSSSRESLYLHSTLVSTPKKGASTGSSLLDKSNRYVWPHDHQGVSVEDHPTTPLREIPLTDFLLRKVRRFTIFNKKRGKVIYFSFAEPRIGNKRHKQEESEEHLSFIFIYFNVSN